MTVIITAQIMTSDSVSEILMTSGAKQRQRKVNPYKEGAVNTRNNENMVYSSSKMDSLCPKQSHLKRNVAGLICELKHIPFGEI